MKIQHWLLKQRQGLPLKHKISMSQRRIRDWYNHFDGNVYVSFSGGKDSTVLLHLVRQIYPNVPAVFVDTGLEYPEIRAFVKPIDNVTWLRPKMNFREVIEKYGYPIVSKAQAGAISRYRNTDNPDQKFRYLNGLPGGKMGTVSKKWQYLIDAPFKISDRCCYILKKDVAARYDKKTGQKPILGMMACEGLNRRIQYLKQGCNSFKNKKPASWPIVFWTDEDIWQYIRDNNLPYSKIYDMGEERTGCIFCCFGLHMEKGNNRFQRMKKTHPKLWNYCINKLGLKQVLETIGVDYE